MNQQNKVMKFIGILYMVLGILFFTAFSVGGVVESDLALGLIGGFMGLIFGGLGFGLYYAQRKRTKQIQKILKEGKIKDAFIYGYQGTNTQIQQKGVFDLVVHYMDYGVEREIVVPTGDTDQSKYPLGGSLSIKILDGKGAIVPGSIQPLYEDPVELSYLLSNRAYEQYHQTYPER